MLDRSKIAVIKKDGTREKYNPDKIVKAVRKSAARVMITLDESEEQNLVRHIEAEMESNGLTDIPILTMHSLVESALCDTNEKVAKSYKDYRNYKTSFVHMMDDVYTKSQSIRYRGDKDNANTDSALVQTKRSLIFGELNKELYRKFFMTQNELQACKDGYIYVHDQSARLDTWNCCLVDISSILRGGFEMGNIWYNEPKTLDRAFNVIEDIALATASQQYGGFTIPELDTVLEPYAEKSFNKYLNENLRKMETAFPEGYELTTDDRKRLRRLAHDEAMASVKRDMEQGIQGIEYRLNTVGSSRGDYPFVTVTFGLGTGTFAKMASITMMEVHAKGQGKEGFRKPVLFPKYVFLYDEKLHGPGDVNEDVFEAGIECSSKTMYPDWLSLTGKGYVASMYKKYGAVVSPMGCVDGQETVTYKFQNQVYNTTIESMWNHLSKHFWACNQPAGPQHLYMGLYGVEIYDMMKGFVDTSCIIRNTSTEWVRIILSNGYSLTCTTDHPLTTEKGVTKRADQLTISDNLYVGEKEPTDYHSTTASVASVKSIERLPNKTGYSYDVTTTSEHFSVSGIWSHNCRAFLSPWYERGGMEPADDDDKPVFVGRFNLGVVSLHLPMILAKAQKESKDFYEVLDYYLELIRGLHKRTYDYLGELHASTNPVMFCEGGAYGGHLKPEDKIKPLLKPMTMSYGITALNELQMLYNGKRLTEDNQFALDVMEYINKRLDEYKHEDGILYAVYGTPAESLCSLQVTQFRKMYGIIEGVSDKLYVSNSFHCHVAEDISPIEKQDREAQFWDLFNGGKIQYVRYPLGYNIEAIRTLVRRAMGMGFYEGVNLALSYCDDCGHQELEMDVCPVCGSDRLTKIDRMNGYLAYSRRGKPGSERLNAGKMAEIADRVSM